MLFYTVLQLIFIIGLCHFPASNTMDTPTQELEIPLIIQNNSEMLKMLANRAQQNGHKQPITFPDGRPLQQTHLDELAKIYEPSFDYRNLTIDELTEKAQLHDYLQITLPANGLQIALCEQLTQKQCTLDQLQHLGSDWHSQLITGHAQTFKRSHPA